MAPLKKSIFAHRTSGDMSSAAIALRQAADDHDPVSSPAHDLQRQLHEAGYRSEAYRPRPMSNAMLVLTVICVYVVSMIMLLGSISA